VEGVGGMSLPVAARDRGLRYALLAAAAWTALTAVAILAEVGRGKAAIRDAAELEARLSFDHLVIARRWNASHGGVFVPVTETLRPSPWLAHLVDRDGRTATGRDLTLMNPAWMTREILELTNRELKVTGHITSLRPMRPENAPDPWERGALERLEAGEASYSELVVEKGEERLRFMGGLKTEQSCLFCHRAQGYKVGDVRGGIAVSVPTAPLLAIGANDTRRQLQVHGTIWLLGLGAIGLALRGHRRAAAVEAEADRRRSDAEAELAAARRLEAVGRLSAGVAHDFNNLLAPILTVSGVVRDELPEQSPLRADLDDIRGAAVKARDLVRALQTLSRTNGGRPARVSVAAIARESERLLRSFAGTRLGFVLRVADSSPTVVADRSLLELALANLVVNAREGAVVGKTIAMDVGAVELAQADADRLHVRAGRHAAVTVSEAGVVSTLFAGAEGFVQVQALVAADPGGAGLGIPTINGIVAQYGGGVVARAAGGAGWILRLLLPEAPTSGAQAG